MDKVPVTLVILVKYFDICLFPAEKMVAYKMFSNTVVNAYCVKFSKTLLLHA